MPNSFNKSFVVLLKYLLKFNMFYDQVFWNNGKYWSRVKGFIVDLPNSFNEIFVVLLQYLFKFNRLYDQFFWNNGKYWFELQHSFLQSNNTLRMFFKWAIPGLFFLYFCLFNTVDSIQMININFADDWIRTSDPWYRKQPLYKLHNNNCPTYLWLCDVITWSSSHHQGIFLFCRYSCRRHCGPMLRFDSCTMLGLDSCPVLGLDGCPVLGLNGCPVRLGHPGSLGSKERVMGSRVRVRIVRREARRCRPSQQSPAWVVVRITCGHIVCCLDLCRQIEWCTYNSRYVHRYKI